MDDITKPNEKIASVTDNERNRLLHASNFIWVAIILYRFARIMGNLEISKHIDLQLFPKEIISIVPNDFLPLTFCIARMAQKIAETKVARMNFSIFNLCSTLSPNKYLKGIILFLLITWHF